MNINLRQPILFVILMALVFSRPGAAEDVLEEFDRPFLFSYLSWENKAMTVNGVAVLRGFDNRGGAGVNGEWDLADVTDLVPVLRLRVGSANTMGSLVLMLKDDGKGEGRWEFPLPTEATPSEFASVWPREGASLKQPNSVGDGVLLDLKKIRQLQLIGDWVGTKTVDIEVDSVLLMPATEAMRTEGLEKQKRLDAEAAARRQIQSQLREQYVAGSLSSPTIEHVSAVACDVLAVEIQAGNLRPSSLSRYEPHPGDKLQNKQNAAGEIESVLLERNGKTLGWLIGPHREWLTTYEEILGDPLLDFVADDATSFSVVSIDDAAYATPTNPIAVSRKSHVNAWAQGPATVGVRHTLYLRLHSPLRSGKTYTLNVGSLNTKQREVTFTFDPKSVRSESVHVNQIGYRPDDPVKQAFVSCWLGTGGALKQPEAIPFCLVDDVTGEKVFEGTGEKHFPADQLELMARDANFNGTDVARCDFSSFDTPGRYRVAIDGVGCSFPFSIANDVWEIAFLTQLRGLYHQRSGIELGPPFTSYVKPRDMNPVDGYQVTQSDYRAVEKGNEAYEELHRANNKIAVPQGWGGYHDAGDWNPRRVTHMRVTMATLEMLELFPEKFATLQLHIPATPGVPDILTEGLFEFDCFMRLQQADGGVGLGMESKGDPLAGEVSWMNSFPSLVYASDYASSWYFAAVGARLSRLLEPYDAKRANEIRENAIRAFAFGEKDYAKDRAAGFTAHRESNWQATDDRNLAALELYRLTKESTYHDVFLEDTALVKSSPNLFSWGEHIQRDQAFHYARLPEGLGVPSLKKTAITAITDLAERSLTYASNNAFNLTTPDKGKPQFIGFYSVSDAADLTRAHLLTQDPRYLKGALRAIQFQSGCNPNNLVYMTGLGANPVKHVFKLDARRTGQAVPSGLVPYGNIDFQRWNHNGITWPITWVIGKATVPDAYAWPTHQAYWDVGGWPMLEEFTVDAWSPNVLVWGYLMARP